ncbi:RluA family pseudouridine synthase [Anabaena cylindrica FACHB-243]|nr:MULTISPECIES: RluA family pseudouridine synthase [Anabaena]MBD2416727.1 RluA family pseudouridine synthase [Anabaena cylindrica FACHB-243]MBY5285027.1 RluA family pseudouridine synthase [Anabaena sp. CCAP 1446/1C]MBY5310336.1 RluA family pseudouridine synthase [Anabaena sp. CCAP 1446/1C]MCM2409852.1 pseudouridine synthase [Anabaena sp. CCAP 1446/1C]
MKLIHTLSDFINSNSTIIPTPPSYYYEGKCPQTGELLRLPRTALAEAIAEGLMQQLQQDHLYFCEGKMYGILLVELSNGEQGVIKAFSGLLHSCSVHEGWVPPIPGREEVTLAEAHTLAELEAIKQEIIHLQQLPEREQYQTLLTEFKQQLQIMSCQHSQSKKQRQEKRQQCGEKLTIEVLEELEAESRQQGIERKYFKRHQNEVLQPLQQVINGADNRIRELKQQRKELSRQLQTQMHAVYSLTNFSGKSLSLQQLLPGGTPTGTGDCCAPKLLHYAADHGLKPLAMAEFWWGKSSVQDKIQGRFYGACAERCQPLMGFLLSGKSKPISPFLIKKEEISSPISEWIIYEDKWLIAVNKPPGLLSVPGRYSYNQDSVLSRLRNLYDMELMTVHRLDQDTSGILLLAKNLFTYSQLSQQFEKRQIHKVYEAILAGSLAIAEGVIDLPLWKNPEQSLYQKVDLERGKPSLTRFRVMGKVGDYTRVEFIPLTGRTHQLRVHAADVRGLGIAILGDRLYGCNIDACRLYLHARELSFYHPHLEETIHLQTATPFSQSVKPA